MSSAMEEIELLERVLLRLGCADSDEKLEGAVGRFLTPVILKLTSTHDNVRAKVVEVLTHIKRRLSSRPQVQVPVDALLDQYKRSAAESPFLQNFDIIFIAMGYPRLPKRERSELFVTVLSCEEKPGEYQDKFFMLLLPTLGDLKLPDNFAERKDFLNLDVKSPVRRNFLMLLQDVLLVPYGCTDCAIPPGLSAASSKRIASNNWSAEELEKIKKGIVHLICSGLFTDLEIFIPLVLASADTRFSVATPAISELSKVSTTLDFTNPRVTAPLYALLAGNSTANSENLRSPCCARVRLKLLQFLVKCHGKGVDTVRGIQVLFEGLFGSRTNQKCKVLSLQFAEILIKEGSPEIITRVSKVILGGITKLIGRDSKEPNDVQNAAYSTLAQLVRTSPHVINRDLQMVLTYFDHVANSSPDIHSSIREALVAMTPAFAWKPPTKRATGEMSDGEYIIEAEVTLNGQQSLLLAMLSDNAESKTVIIQNITSAFLTTCYPEYYAPARYLLLLIVGERNSLREDITNHLYGATKKDHIDYNAFTSIDYPKEIAANKMKLNADQRQIVLPSFRAMMRHVHEMSQKRLSKNSTYVLVGNTKLPFSLEVHEEILDYLRICLWFSAGIKVGSGDEKFARKFRKYIVDNYEEKDDNELFQYLQFVQRSVEAKRSESNLLCLYDLLNAAPEMLSKSQKHLLKPLMNSLKDVSETMRVHVAQVYAILLAYGFDDVEFNAEIKEYITSLPQKTVENKHGWLLVLGNAFNRKIQIIKDKAEDRDFSQWQEFLQAMKIIVKSLAETQWLLVSAAVKCISMIGKIVEIPNVDVELVTPMLNNDDEEQVKERKACTKLLIFGVVSGLFEHSFTRNKLREEAAKCLGYLAIGDGKYFTKRNLDKFLSLVKMPKDATLNIAVSEAIASTLNGYDVSAGDPKLDFVNAHCNENDLQTFLQALVRLVSEPIPHCRQATAVWLLAIVKHCSHRPALLQQKHILQFAFTELLSDDSEFVQDVASRGLGLVYTLSDANSQNELANSLLDQLIGGKRNVNKVTEETELFAEGMLGKTPTGGNITTYKELCSLASDLNQPDMIYQFMQLANHNAAWTSKLGAAFGLKSLSKDAKVKLQPYLGKIIPRLYRYKYDPTPKIQNSMISIWDSIVTDSKEVVEQFYWDILREILDNLTYKEWRVRIACCLAVRDLMRRPNGLKLRSDERNTRDADVATTSDNRMDTDEVPEPELKELWSQLFRVMDDIHEGTRLAAQGSVAFLSKLCVVAVSSDHGKSGTAVASSIIPLLLETGVNHTVPEIRNFSIRTISEMIDSSGELIAPHLPTLIPALLKVSGELESARLSYLSTRVSADNNAQEIVDSLRAEAAKCNHTMEATSKCVRYVDYAALEKMTPAILDLIKSSINLGTRISTAHFVCLISNRLGQEMTPLVSKYLGACFVGLKDRTATVRKYYANTIGHLIGVAKEQSIKNLFVKLDQLYMEDSSNRSIALTIQAINKRQHDLLKDYMESVLPLVFFAMHEKQTEENKSNIELWTDLWNEISPGASGIRMNLQVIIPKLEESLEDDSWLRKVQGANAINAIATRLGTALDESYRLRLIILLLTALQGRTFDGKERLLQAIAALCKGLDRKHEICDRIIEAALRECRKEEPRYRTQVLISLGDILEELEADRFEEVYEMTWYLLDKKHLKEALADQDDYEDADKVLSADERNRRAQILSKLKETVCDTLGKSWPKNSIETQEKLQVLFAEYCAQKLKDSTRPVQVSLMVALSKFIERLHILNSDDVRTSHANSDKKMKVDLDQTRDEKIVVEKICKIVLSAVVFASAIPHTGLKKEALNIILLLIKRLAKAKDVSNLRLVKSTFEETLECFQRDSAPEIRCRIKDIEERISKCNL